ncbi:hypothetical protein D3C75_1162580 [compost metagenome]
MELGQSTGTPNTVIGISFGFLLIVTDPLVVVSQDVAGVGRQGEKLANHCGHVDSPFHVYM